MASWRSPGGWAEGAAVAACVAFAGQLALDAASRLVDIAARPARFAFDLGLVACSLLALAVVSELVAGPSNGRRRQVALMAAALVVSVAAMAIRAADGLLEPVGRRAAPLELAGAALALLRVLPTMRGVHRRAAARRAPQVLALALLVTLPVGAVVDAPAVLGDIRTTEMRVLASAIVLLSLMVSAVALASAEKARAALAALAAAVVTTLAARAWSTGGSPAWWAVGAALSAGLLLAPADAISRASALIAAARPVARGAAQRSTAITRLVRRRVRTTFLPTGTDGAVTALTPHRMQAADRPWTAVIVVVTVVSVVADVVWALRAGAQPIGHSATVAARAWDVGTANHPLIGMPTSFADNNRTLKGQHPGPMLFDALAPFVKVLGIRTGAFVGSAALTLGCWLLAVWAAFCAGGRAAALGAWLAGAVVTHFVLRSAVFDSLNTFPAFLALLAIPLLCWAATTGTRKAFPWAVALASLSTQAYLAHAMVTVVPVAWAAGVLWVESRRDRRDREAGRWLRWGAVVLVACWAQPAIEALRHDGGNVRALWSGTIADRPTLGLSGLWRAPAWMLQVPLTWHRLERVFAPDWRPYLGGLTLVGPLILAALVAAWVASRRVATTAERRLWVVAGLVLVSSGLALVQFPVAFTAFYQLTWLAGAAVFIWFVVFHTFGSLLARASPVLLGAGWLRPLAFAVSTTLVLAWGLRTPSSLESLKGRYSAIDRSAPDLVREVSAAAADEPEVLLLGLDGSAQQITADLLAAYLIADGHTVRVEPFLGPYYGQRRMIEAGWTGTVYLVAEGAAPVHPNGRLVVRVEPEGWSARGYARSAARLRRWALANGPIVLDRGAAPTLQPYVEPWLPGVTCADLARIDEGQVPLSSLPAGAIARLYVDELVVSPQLPARLRAEMEAVIAPTPTEVWRVERTEPGAVLESARLQRDLRVCDQAGGDGG